MNERGHFSPRETTTSSARLNDGHDAPLVDFHAALVDGKVGTIVARRPRMQLVCVLEATGLSAMIPQDSAPGWNGVGPYYEQATDIARRGPDAILAWIYGEQNRCGPMFPPILAGELISARSRSIFAAVAAVYLVAALRHFPS